jgi:hypothetical protein
VEKFDYLKYGQVHDNRGACPADNFGTPDQHGFEVLEDSQAAVGVCQLAGLAVAQEGVVDFSEHHLHGGDSFREGVVGVGSVHGEAPGVRMEEMNMLQFSAILYSVQFVRSVDRGENLFAFFWGAGLVVIAFRGLQVWQKKNG